MSISSVIGSLGAGLEQVLQDVEKTVVDLISTVESVVGALTGAVIPTSAPTGLSGLLASAPGSHSLALSVPGLVQHTAAAIPSVGGAHADVSGGHSVPFADNTVVSIAPIKHN